MANGIYCETLLRVHQLRSDSFWYALTFEREGDGRKPKTFFCCAELARNLEAGEIYLFSAKGRYILRVASEVPVGHLFLAHFRLWLSFARKPFPAPCRNIADAIESGLNSDILAEFIAVHSDELRACLPRFRHHWQSEV